MKKISIKTISVIVFSAVFIFTPLFLNISLVFANYGVQTKTSNCISSTLPDSACSPGAVLTTNIKTICTVGYTKTVRNVTETTKKKVFKEYGIPWSNRGNYEVDHIISLELGGSNDISNLFPESYLIKDNARIKDKFENYLHKQVCDGKMTIDEAQKEISSNWLDYYQVKVLGKKSDTTIPVISTPIIQNKETTNTSEPAVKKSSTSICHAKGTTYYTRTTKFTSYSSISDCLASGGRLPK